MYKHIKIKAELIPPTYDEVEVTLLAQSHFGSAFGGNVSQGRVFTYKGARIISNALGGVSYEDDRCTEQCVRFWLPGDPYTFNTVKHITTKVPLDCFSIVKEGIEAYNHINSK